MRSLFVSLAVIVLLFGSEVWADEPWWQWRGPQRNDISPAKGLLKNWDSAPPVVWKIKKLGFGYSSPVVSNGIVCAIAERGPRSIVAAIDDKTGKELWATQIDAAKYVRTGDRGYPGPYSTPAIDGERIYALSDGGQFVCLETATGKMIWRKDLIAEYRGRTDPYGYCESPLVDGDKVMCTPGGPEAGIVALDKKTGKEIWRCDVSFPDPKDGKERKSRGAPYASMAVSHVAGVKQYVQLMDEGPVGVDADTGKQLWSYRLRTTHWSLGTAIIRDDYVLAHNVNHSVLLKLKKQKEEISVEKIYGGGGQFMGDRALIGDHLYVIDGDAMHCTEFLTGKLAWQKSLPNTHPLEGRMAYADGHFYFQSGRDALLMVAANPKGCQLKGSLNFPRDIYRPTRESWSQVAISNGRLYVRESNLLYCYDLKKK